MENKIPEIAIEDQKNTNRDKSGFYTKRPSVASIFNQKSIEKGSHLHRKINQIEKINKIKDKIQNQITRRQQTRHLKLLNSSNQPTPK